MRSFGILLTALSLAYAGAQTPAPGRGVQAQSAQSAPAAPRAQPGDIRPFGLIVATAPDEFLLVGSGLSPSFTPDSPRPKLAGIGSIDEGRFEKGTWVPGRRLNGDEFRPNLRPGAIGMLKVKLYRHD